RTAALREDLDHAAGRLTPVQRGRGRTLDDLHALDVLRVQVAQAAHDLAAQADHVHVALIDADAVDVDERLVVLGEAGDPAEHQGAGGADRTARSHAHDARLTPLEQVLDAGDRRIAELRLDVDGGDPGPDRAAALHAGRRTGDDQLIERDRGERELEIDDDGLPIGDLDRLGNRPVTDPLGLDLIGPRRD